MSFIYCDDIQYIINKYIIDLKTILAWKHTCVKNMYIKFYISLIVNKKMGQIIYKNIFTPNNIFYIHDKFNIIKINILPYYFNDNYLINFKQLRKLDCSYTNKISDLSVKQLTVLTSLYCNNVLTDNSIKCLTKLIKLDIKFIAEESLKSSVFALNVTPKKQIILFLILLFKIL